MKTLLLVIFCFAMGCIDDVAESETIQVDANELGKDDASPRLVGRKFKLGLQSALQPTVNGSYWTIQGLSSLELTQVEVSVAGVILPSQTDGTTFDVGVDLAALEELAFGSPMIVNAASGEQVASLSATFAPRWVNRRGSSKIELDVDLQPVVKQGGQPALRATSTTREGFAIESVFTDDDQSPTIYRDFDWRWQMDWSREQLGFLVDFEQDRVFFTVVDSDDTRYEKSAQLRIKAASVTWSSRWLQPVQPQCSSSTRFCLHHLPPDARDAQECGLAEEVLACFRPDAAN